MKLRPLEWQDEQGVITARVLGVTLSVFKNNDKWDARLSTPHQRPETETGFDTKKEALRYAEHILLVREFKKYFTRVGD